MGKSKRLYTFVEVDDSTPVQKLPILDQIRVLLKQWTYDAANELKSEDAVTQEYMAMKSTLLDFLHKATEPIRAGKHKDVIVSVSSVFNPVFEDVIKSHEISDFYEVYVATPKLEYDIPYDFLVKLVVKEK